MKILNEKTKILVSSDYGAPRKDKEYNLNDLLENCNFVPTSSLLFRTNLIKDLPKSFHKYPFGDWPLQMIVLLRNGSEKFGCIQEEMAVYRIHHSGNRSSLNFIDARKRIIRCYLIAGFYLKLFQRFSWRKGYARWKVEMSLSYYKNNRLFLHLYHLFIALIISPSKYKIFYLNIGLKNWTKKRILNKFFQ